MPSPRERKMRRKTMTSTADDREGHDRWAEEVEDETMAVTSDEGPPEVASTSTVASKQPTVSRGAAGCAGGRRRISPQSALGDGLPRGVMPVAQQSFAQNVLVGRELTAAELVRICPRQMTRSFAMDFSDLMVAQSVFMALGRSLMSSWKCPCATGSA